MLAMKATNHLVQKPYNTKGKKLNLYILSVVIVYRYFFNIAFKFLPNTKRWSNIRTIHTLPKLGKLIRKSIRIFRCCHVPICIPHLS